MQINKNQKLLLIVTLVMFWMTIIYVPNCGGTDLDPCGAMDEFEFMWSTNLFGVYVPMLLLEWFGIVVNFVALFFYLKDSQIKNKE